jgi:hypothetical protein
MVIYFIEEGSNSTIWFLHIIVHLIMNIVRFLLFNFCCVTLVSGLLTRVWNLCLRVFFFWMVSWGFVWDDYFAINNPLRNLIFSENNWLYKSLRINLFINWLNFSSFSWRCEFNFWDYEFLLEKLEVYSHQFDYWQIKI